MILLQDSRDAARDAPDERSGERQWVTRVAACEGHQDPEPACGGSVVEQALGFNKQAQARLHLQFLEGGEHGNGVRRRDQHTEQPGADLAPASRKCTPTATAKPAISTPGNASRTVTG